MSALTRMFLGLMLALVLVGSPSSTGQATTPSGAATVGAYSPEPYTRIGFTLKNGEGLLVGSCLISSQSAYEACLTPTGQFQIRVYRRAGDGEVLWSIDRSGTRRVLFDAEGNLKLLDADWQVLWSSQTAPAAGGRVTMENDGALVVYSRGNLPLWSSRNGRSAYRSDRLVAGTSLKAGQSIVSGNGQFRALMQADGNFVVYREGGGATWALHTQGPGNWLAVQGDGNVVLYTSQHRPLWSSASAIATNTVLVMQNDGNLVQYSDGKLPIWASSGRTPYRQDAMRKGGTLTQGQRLISTNGRYQAVLQGDGNFVVYEDGGRAIWSTGARGTRLALQGDGNLVLYDNDGRPRWWTSTGSAGEATLVMQNDGNLVLYADRAQWSSKTGRINPPTPQPQDGYPDKDAVYCGTSTWCKNGSPYSVRRFAYRNCTDFVAWRLNIAHGDVSVNGSAHAREWKQGWINRGRPWGTTPRVGSVAWWGTSVGSYGHVGVVTAVNPDGSAQVEQYNWGGAGTYSVRTVRAEAYLYR